MTVYSMGKVLEINALISYEGNTIDELKTDLYEAVDEYLILCERQRL